MLEANGALDDAPEPLNEPAWTAWLARVKLSDVNEGDLLDAAAYEAVVKEEAAKA